MESIVSGSLIVKFATNWKAARDIDSGPLFYWPQREARGLLGPASAIERGSGLHGPASAIERGSGLQKKSNEINELTEKAEQSVKMGIVVCRSTLWRCVGVPCGGVSEYPIHVSDCTTRSKKYIDRSFGRYITVHIEGDR